MTCIDVKFIFDGVRLGLSSSSNILQIANVTSDVVFFLFLLCFTGKNNGFPFLDILGY